MKSVPILPRLPYIRACTIALALLFAADAALFRTPWYRSVLEPDSSTGLFEMTLTRELGVQRSTGDNLVLTIGDSRFAFSMKLADRATPPTGYLFRLAGIAGTNARSWYYLLRDLDPTAARYRAIVIGVTDYDDEDEAFNPHDDIRALHYTVMRLRWSDVPSFALSFDDPRLRWQALRGALLRGAVLQNDVHGFLDHPRKRLDYIALCRTGWADWTYGYMESPKSMAGLAIDWASLTATFPPGVTEDQRQTVQTALLRPPQPQTGRTAEFRRRWLGRILDRYRGSRTKIIFVRLPRGAIPRPDYLSVKSGATIREFASRPGVWLCPEHAFDSLERPEFFRDGIHLNRDGIAQFSPMLAAQIASMLGPPDAI